jgi:hypothetical protein
VNEEGEAVGDGRIWVWGDGEEGSLAGVKKSWEALEYEASDSGSDSDSDDEDDDQEDEEDTEVDEDETSDQGEGSGSQSGGRRGKRRRDSSEATKKKPRREVDPDKVSPWLPFLFYEKLMIATAPTPSCPRSALRPSTAILRIRHFSRHVGCPNALPLSD